MINPRPSSSLPPVIRRFRAMGAITLWAVYVLILIGGIVRGTGAGMGCPDWPKCFGRWVPPTSVAELPADYLTTYRDGRIAKNQQVAQRLDRMGFHDVAANIFRHPATYIETEFNVTKTWIEYVNRLVGALIGLLITLTFWRSLTFWKHDKVVTVVSGLALITVGVQGWLGSLVVSTNLVPAVVTWHMALALGLLMFLHYAHWRAGVDYEVRITKYDRPLSSGALRWLAVSLVGLTFVQILLGTQVREGVDQVAAAFNYLNRDLWVSRLGTDLSWHRAFSTLLLLANVYVGWRLWTTADNRLQRLTLVVGGLLMLNMTVGIALAQFALPAWLQPVHLTVATLLFGAQVLVVLTLTPVPVGARGIHEVGEALPTSVPASRLVHNETPSRV